MEHGSSLIEVLVAFSLVTFLVLSLIQITLHALFIKRRSETALIAMELADEKAETLKARYYKGNVSEGAEGKSSRSWTDPVDQFFIEWNVHRDESGLLGLEVSCRARSTPVGQANIMLYLCEELGF